MEGTEKKVVDFRIYHEVVADCPECEYELNEDINLDEFSSMSGKEQECPECSCKFILGNSIDVTIDRT